MLRDILTRHKLIQAPMAGVQGPELASAVTHAGAIGSLPAAMLGVDALRDALQSLDEFSCSRYNINFFCHQQANLDTRAAKRWRDALEPYYAEFGADPNAPAGPARAPFSQAALAVLQDFKPRIVSFHFGLPSEELLREVKAMGSLVLGCATSIDEAHWLEERGADGVIAQGIEAGGHQGSFLPVQEYPALPCVELVQSLVAQLSVPVVAAGGIATSEDAQTAIEAGATAVQVGSAFLQAKEANTSAIHRAALQSEAARRTELTNVFSGRRARGIVNRAMLELGPLSDLPPAFPHAAEAMAPLRSAAEAQGSGDFTPLWSGERGYLSESRPAAEIVQAIMPSLV